MLDIKLIRENKEEIKTKLLKRMDFVSFDELLLWDKEKRSLISKIGELREKRNSTSKLIGKLKNSGEDISSVSREVKSIGETISKLESEVNELEEKIHKFMSSLPNIPDDDVVGGDKESNVVIKTYGEKPQFNFEIKNHVDLCKDLNLIDYQRGTKLSGNGFWIYKGIGARLEWGLINFFISEHLNDGYEFLMVPYILNEECGYVAGQFPKFKEDVFEIDNKSDNKTRFLLPTAETALVNYRRDEIIPEDNLPLKYFSYTACFRREAGSAGTDERGTIRGHQFNKVEMVQYAHPDKSKEAFEELLFKAESLMQKLDLHYRVSKLAAKDCSASMARTYDIEVWLPSMGIYKEVSSVSNANDYQARRGNIKVRESNGTKRFLHTLNASGLATSRLVPAIVEQNQQIDGSVIVPKVLVPFVGTDIIKQDN